jgi:hypothetical protein
MKFSMKNKQEGDAISFVVHDSATSSGQLHLSVSWRRLSPQIGAISFSFNSRNGFSPLPLPSLISPFVEVMENGGKHELKLHRAGTWVTRLMGHKSSVALFVGARKVCVCVYV